MVRKRAIRALWECCSCPGFSRAGDAVVAVLNRANDKEDSMKHLVTKICGEMWFTDASSFAGGLQPCTQRLKGCAAAPSMSAAWRTCCRTRRECGCQVIRGPGQPASGEAVFHCTCRQPVPAEACKQWC